MMKTVSKHPRMGTFTLSRMADSQLVWLYNETGDRKFYCELFMRYLPLIYGLCLKYVPEEQQAKAVVKRLFDHILEEFDQTDFYGDTFRDWLYVHSRDYIEDYSRRNRLQERRFFSSGVHNTLSERAYDLFRLLDKGDQTASALFETAKDRLTGAEATCIGLFFFKRKCFRSISSSTGYLASAVKRHIETGLEKIAFGMETTELHTVMEEA